MTIIVMGPSASGKDSFVERIIKRSKGKFKRIVSTTSRPMRDGETEGKEYHFISQTDFKRKKASGDFIEYRSYDTCVEGKKDIWYYGTEKFEPNNKEVRFAIKDPSGAIDVANYCKSIGERFVFILFDCDEKTRTKRAKLRGSFDETEWNRRLEADRKDFPNALQMMERFQKSFHYGCIEYIRSTDDDVKTNINDMCFYEDIRYKRFTGCKSNHKHTKLEQGLLKCIYDECCKKYNDQYPGMGVSLESILRDYVSLLKRVGMGTFEITDYLFDRGFTGEDILKAYKE